MLRAPERQDPQSALRFRTIVNQATTGVVQADATGLMTLVNQRWCEMLGYAEAELLQMTVAEVTHPDSLEPAIEAVRRIAENCSDGSVFWASSSVHVVCGPAGRVRRRLGSVAVRVSGLR